MGFLLFFPQLSTLVSMPLSPPTALGGSLPFTCRLFGAACFKTEELRWGSPTATPPFEPLDLAPKDGMILPSLTLPALKDMSSFRVSVSAYFRVIPCSSVANASAWSSFRG